MDWRYRWTTWFYRIWHSGGSKYLIRRHLRIEFIVFLRMVYSDLWPYFCFVSLELLLPYPFINSSLWGVLSGGQMPVYKNKSQKTRTFLLLKLLR
jgi:hypothetical protein